MQKVVVAIVTTVLIASPLLAWDGKGHTHFSTKFFKVARYLFSESARFIQKDSLFNLRTPNIGPSENTK
jgi:hypothetical protein